MVVGVVGVAMPTAVGRAAPPAPPGAAAPRWFLVVGGTAYLALWLYGLAIDHGSAWNFVPVNTADDWLHFGLGIGMVVLGLVLPKRVASSPGPGAGGMPQ
jgi:hypothetical protein